jgi:anti-sigma-K factor RskA
MRHLIPLVLADVPDESSDATGSKVWLIVAVAAVAVVALVAVIILVRRRGRTPE